MGAHGISVDRDDQVPDAIDEALAAGRATVIHLTLDPAWVSVDQPAVSGQAALEEPAATAS
jgi:thiamine pyrophosphate-dependent acetolactate synthase large subunit-like protein